MLVDERHDIHYVSDLIDEIFSSPKDKALYLIEHHSKFLRSIAGLRGGIGKVTARAKFEQLFEVGDANGGYHIDDSGLDEAALDELESKE
jgi:hypothetical protein